MTEPSPAPEASVRLRMMAVVMLVSVLVVGLVDALYIASDEGLRRHMIGPGLWSLLLRDAALVALLSIGVDIALDRLVLRPLRRAAARAAAFDPTLPPRPFVPEADGAEPVAELQQISQSLARVHRNLWQRLRDEQGRTAELESEITRQRGALLETQQALDGKTRELSGMSRIDALTGLANRREFDEALRREFKRTQRERGLLALAVLDLDHFKAYNEHYGGAAGDAALARFAQLLSIRFKRDTDLVARLSGAKFVALLPGFDVGAAQDLLEQVRSDLQAPQIPHDGAGTLSASGQRVLTVSIGLACYSPIHPYLSGQTLMEAADEALYIAKHAGRDRLSLAASGGNS